MRISGRTLLTVATIATVPLLTGLGGVFAVCHQSALNPRNFFADGHCHASDTPSDVFTSFLVLGCLLATLITVTLLVSSFLRRRHLEGKG